MKQTLLPKSLGPVLSHPAQLVALLFSVLATISAVVFFFTAQPEIPLLYTLSLPEQALVPKIYIFILPALSFFTLIINLVFLHQLHREKDIIFLLFSWSNMVVQLLFFTAIIRIITITT